MQLLRPVAISKVVFKRRMDKESPRSNSIIIQPWSSLARRELTEIIHPFADLCDWMAATMTMTCPKVDL
jgi:hypothetical protein